MRINVIVGALLLVAGVAVAGWGWSQRTPASNKNAVFDRGIAALDAAMKTAQVGIEQRAKGLSESAYLKRGMKTDTGTLKDMVGTEIIVNPDKVEILEFGQEDNGGTSKGGVTRSLLREPATASSSPHFGKEGFYTDVFEGNLVVTKVVKVDLGPPNPLDDTPPDRMGIITVRWRVNLTEQIGPLVAAGIRSKLATPNGGIVLGNAPPSTGDLVTRPLVMFPELSVVGEVPNVPARTMLSFVVGGAVAALLGLVLLVAGLARRGAAALPSGVIPHGSTGLAVEPVGQTLGLQATRLGPGTPSAIRTAASPAPSGGTVLGRYELVRRIGSGGMAEVFLANSLGEAGFTKSVALKLMHPYLGTNASAVDHFLDEARLASQLSHPNIVQITDLGKVDDSYYIAMEYVDGSDLDGLLQSSRDAGRPVPLAIALTILRRVCDGLDFAHNAVGSNGQPMSLVHRDVKSANVMISTQGVVKVGDFGIAKASTQVHVTQIGEAKGTPSMMAPEQRMGKPVDARADVYAVAAVAYEIFTGTVVNLDLAIALEKGFDGWPHLPPPSTLRSDLPPELDAIVMAALAFDPNSRPPSCHVFEEQLAAVASKYQLTADGKDLARWLAGELGVAPSVRQATATPVSLA